MNFFQKLFGSKEETPEEEREKEKEKNFDVLKYDGVRALRTGQFQYAIKCFLNALEIDDDLEIHDYLSRAYIYNNELLPAYKELEILAKAEPDNQDILIRMANVAYMTEDYDTMADVCEKAMKLSTDNPLVYYFYARAKRGQGDYVNALAMVTKAIELDDGRFDFHLLRGEILLDMDDTEGADKEADWLLKHDANEEDALLFKARVEKKKGDNKLAIHYYNKLTDVNPFRIEAYRERGALRLAIGDKEGAEEDGQKLLELNPQEEAEVEKLEKENKGEAKEE